MNYFQDFSREAFDLSLWESLQAQNTDIQFDTFGSYDPDQFIIFQLGETQKAGVLFTNDVIPKLKGSKAKPDINLTVDIDAFWISDDDKIDPNSKIMLQLVVGQERPSNNWDKLFFCINAGLDLYNSNGIRFSEGQQFRKGTNQAFGQKPISLPGGLGSITLKVVKHQEPPWWKSIFDFAKTNSAKDLISLVGFGGITGPALKTVGIMMDSLFTKPPELLFKSESIKTALSVRGQMELSGGSDLVRVSCLNEGFWLMCRIKDYDLIREHRPTYFAGNGMLAPDHLNYIEASSEKNPFRKMTYFVLKVKAKEIDLNAY